MKLEFSELAQTELEDARVVVHKFPYSIFYVVLDECVVIISVAHQHRKPFYECNNV